MDRHRVYKVVIDGRQAGEMWPGQRLTLHVPSGARRIFVEIDVMRSNELVVSPQPGDVIDLTCRGFGSLLALFNTVFRRKAYLDLRVMTPAERAAGEAASSPVPKPRNIGDGRVS